MRDQRYEVMMSPRLMTKTRRPDERAWEPESHLGEICRRRQQSMARICLRRSR